jgi:hypothetical protein
MGRMTPEIMATELPMGWQTFFTWASWIITIAMFVFAVRMCMKQRTPFYAIALLAVCVGAFAEPIYDVGFDLWFYDVHNGEPGAMWSHFTAFGVVQPNWSHSGYVILYGAIALYAGRRLYEGRITKKGLFAIWGAEILTSVVFEVIGTKTIYTYYGPYELRIFEYPLVIGVLEGTQTLIFTIVAVQIWRRAKHWSGQLSLFSVFPITMMGVNLGLGMPVIIALHLKPGEFSSSIVWAATFFVMASCALVVNGAYSFLPKPFGTPEPDGAAQPEAARLEVPAAPVREPAGQQ